jgi:hypothetical protein
MPRSFDLSAVTTQGKAGCVLKFIPAKNLSSEENKGDENHDSENGGGGSLIHANSIFFEDHLRP